MQLFLNCHTVQFTCKENQRANFLFHNSDATLRVLLVCCCGEGELVGGVHTLVWRSEQVYRELLELEEEDEGREEVQEIEKGESSRGEPLTWT